MKSLLPSWMTQTIRKVRAEKAYFVINIVGLSVGAACFSILFLYINQQLNYDQHNALADRIYRINHETDYAGNRALNATTSSTLAPLLDLDYPDIEAYVTFTPHVRGLFSYEEGAYYEEGVYVADNAVFDVFTHRILYGDAATALSEPASIAISESFSRRYFGNMNPLGETLQAENNLYTVTLVFQDLPENTHFKYDALVANEGGWKATSDSRNLWNVSQGFSYLLLAEDHDYDVNSEVFPDFFNNRMAEITREGGYRARFYLEPLASIHYEAKGAGDLPRGNRIFLYGLGSIAFFILLVACINYINLSTSQSIKRAKEVELRKILGASKGKLVLCFLTESLLLSVASAVTSFIIIVVMLNTSAIGLAIGNEDITTGWYLRLGMSVFSLCLVAGLLSGIYPAWHAATSSRPSSRKSDNSHSSRLRQALVLLQFTIAISVISITFLMYSQMQYVQNKTLGFETENRLLLTLQSIPAIERVDVFIEKLMSHPGIIDVTVATAVPLEGTDAGGAMETVGDNGVAKNLQYSTVDTDAHYLDVMGLNLLEGRFFREGGEASNANVVVNKALVNQADWSDPVGAQYRVAGNNYTVIGVVENFHFDSLHGEISPFVIAYDDRNFDAFPDYSHPWVAREMVVHFSAGFADDVYAFINSEWGTFNSERPLEAVFLQDVINAMYRSDRIQMVLIGIFAALCVFISCLGLYGLMAFATRQRAREIGIRKVLGSSGRQIIFLLFQDVLVLILLGSLIATGFSYWAIQQWLDSFHYREDIRWIAFPAAAFVAIVVSFLATALQSKRTVEQSPSLSLKME